MVRQTEGIKNILNTIFDNLVILSIIFYFQTLTWYDYDRLEKLITILDMFMLQKAV